MLLDPPEFVDHYIIQNGKEDHHHHDNIMMMMMMMMMMIHMKMLKDKRGDPLLLHHFHVKAFVNIFVSQQISLLINDDE